MGLFDFLLNPEKQIEKENKLLAKPGHTVAEITAYNEYDRDETYEDEEGQTQWRTIREATISFRYQIDGQWRKEDLGPSEGYRGYYVGQQLIVRLTPWGSVRFVRTLRRDSPNRI